MMIPSECQTDWTQIRPKDLIWVQTICQGYQQPKLVDIELINKSSGLYPSLSILGVCWLVFVIFIQLSLENPIICYQSLTDTLRNNIYIFSAFAVDENVILNVLQIPI